MAWKMLSCMGKHHGIKKNWTCRDSSAASIDGLENIAVYSLFECWTTVGEITANSEAFGEWENVAFHSQIEC